MGGSMRIATSGKTEGSVTDVGGVATGELVFGELARVRLAGEVYSNVDWKRGDRAS
jgi:hypothetical protein